MFFNDVIASDCLIDDVSVSDTLLVDVVATDEAQEMLSSCICGTAFRICAPRRRLTKFEGTVYEVDGTTEVPMLASGSLIVRIGRNGQTALEIDSEAETAGGSSVTYANNSPDYELILGVDDSANLLPGKYTIDIAYADPAADDAEKQVAAGTLIITDTLPGAA